MNDYQYIYCVDLASQVLYDGEISTLQALNKFTEEQLEYADEQKIRKYKLNKIEKSIE